MQTKPKSQGILTKNEAGTEEEGEGRADSVIFISKKHIALKKNNRVLSFLSMLTSLVCTVNITTQTNAKSNSFQKHAL